MHFLRRNTLKSLEEMDELSVNIGLVMKAFILKSTLDDMFPGNTPNIEKANV